MAKPVKREPKKPYEKPSLRAYGTVTELTKRVGTHGAVDHGVPPHHKTQV